MWKPIVLRLLSQIRHTIVIIKELNDGSQNISYSKLPTQSDSIKTTKSSQSAPWIWRHRKSPCQNTIINTTLYSNSTNDHGQSIKEISCIINWYQQSYFNPYLVKPKITNSITQASLNPSFPTLSCIKILETWRKEKKNVISQTTCFLVNHVDCISQLDCWTI